MTVRARRSLMQMALGGMATHVVGAAAKMEIADAIGDRELTPAELADRVGTPEHTMLRLLRALAALGICAERPPGRFALTETGSLLRRDAEGSVHSFVRMFTDPVMLAAWARLDSSVRTGRTTFEDVFGMPFFEHLAGEPELSALFNASMSQGTGAMAAQVSEYYDFGRYARVVDVGGGDGTLLGAILKANPAVRGVVFDSPQGVAQADHTLAAAGVADRCVIETGDFFEAVPGGADLYVLKSIIHDWDDERAAKILGHCRAALPGHGRVLIVEPVLPDVVAPDGLPGAYLSDLNMLVNVGGRERTRTDFEQVCARAGLAVTEVTALPPNVGFSLIEAKPA